MTTATSVEKPRPTDIGITTPETAEAAVVAKVERLLREHDPNRPLGQVRPVTAVTPVPPSADLATVQAERVGSQEPIINPADVAHNVKIARSLFTGESIWARIGRAFGWVNLIKRRAAQKRTAQKAYKPIDI